MKPRLAIARTVNGTAHLSLVLRLLSADPYAGETEDSDQTAHVVILAHREYGQEADEREQQGQADYQKAMAFITHHELSNCTVCERLCVLIRSSVTRPPESSPFSAGTPLEESTQRYARFSPVASVKTVCGT